MEKFQYETFDLGSSPAISVPMETVEVIINPDDMVKDYAHAFVNEATRVNPNLVKQVKLTAKEMEDYSKFLLVQRVKTVEGSCDQWRRLKLLYIPVFLQYALRMVGEVVIRDQGLTLKPTIDDENTINVEQAIKISEKISYFEDLLQMVVDAMPRDIKGDVNVMSSALIANYVRSMRRVDHVSDTYICAFLGLKLKEEQAFQVLYRIQYDDYEFIKTALMHERRLM